MSLFGAIFQDANRPDRAVAVLALAGFESIGACGRFRDAWFEKSEQGDLICAVYTRNGMGNRECSCWGSEEHGEPECKHEVITVQAHDYKTQPKNDPIPEGWEHMKNVHMGNTIYVRTIEEVQVQRYKCLEPSSIECACTGCIMTYRIPAMDTYIEDHDDDFDGTYNTSYFKPVRTEENANLYDVALEVAEDNRVVMSDVWRDALDALKS